METSIPPEFKAGRLGIGMKTVFKGWDDIDKIIQKGLTLFMRRRDGNIASYRLLRTRITRAARWGHRALPPLRIAITHAPRPRWLTAAPYRHYTRALRTRCSHAHGPGGAMVGRRDSRLAPRGTRGDEARETKVGWAVFLRGQNNSDRMES